MTSWPDPHDSVVRLPGYQKDASHEAFLNRLNALMATEQWASARDSQAAALPLIYIVGAPRSGTTLLSQLFAKYTDAGYITNLAAKFWERPGIGIRLAQVCLRDDARRAISLRSTYGTTSDPAGPHEFGYFWRRWLPLDTAPSHHLSDAVLAGVDAPGLREALEAEILGASGRPVVMKNVICGFHARFLTAVHPASLFVSIRRDPIETASSVLHARRERFGSFDAWWSLKPAAMAEVLRPGDPAGEVARQVDHCRREIAAELADPSVHALEVDYDSLCADPGGTLQRILDAAAMLGGRIARTTDAITPLPRSTGPAIDAAHREVIARYYSTPRDTHAI